MCPHKWGACLKSGELCFSHTVLGFPNSLLVSSLVEFKDSWKRSSSTFQIKLCHFTLTVGSLTMTLPSPPPSTESTTLSRIRVGFARWSGCWWSWAPSLSLSGRCIAVSSTTSDGPPQHLWRYSMWRG